MYINWYMMWYLKKDMLCKEYIFLNVLSFLKRSVRRPFFSWSGRRLSSIFQLIWPSSVVQLIRSTWNLFVHLREFRTHLKFYNRVRDHISYRVRNRMNDLFCWSRVRTPGLAHDLFLWVQGSNPCPCSTIFLWVQGSVPWPWLPVFGLVYHWHTSLTPTNGATGGTAKQKYSY